MELAQARIVTDNVEALAGFYAALVGTPVALNEYYVEVPAGPASVGFSRRRFTEYREELPLRPGHRNDVILDFSTRDVDAQYGRIAAMDVGWVLPPTTQPWGNRSMIFRDPGGNLVNVFSRTERDGRLATGRCAGPAAPHQPPSRGQRESDVI